jgi:hypothetical protein
VLEEKGFIFGAAFRTNGMNDDSDQFEAVSLDCAVHATGSVRPPASEYLSNH